MISETVHVLTIKLYSKLDKTIQEHLIQFLRIIEHYISIY